MLHRSLVELAAAHEEIAFWIGTNVFALLIVELRTANGTVIPPVVWRIFLSERPPGSILH